MLTEFGKELRKIRIDRNIKLGEMAKAINISTSHLSSIEYGRKSTNDDIINNICTRFKLKEEESKSLKKKAYLSMDKYVLNVKNLCTNNTPKLKETAAVFARSMGDSLISEKQAAEILNILNREESPD